MFEGSGGLGCERARLFNDQNAVYVTNARAIIYNQTYAMAQVSSVAGVKVDPDQTWPIILIVMGLIGLLIGLVVAFVAVGSTSTGDTSGVWTCAICSGVVSLAMLGLGMLLFVLKKTTFVVRLRTSGGEVDAFSTTDEAYANGVLDAINNAIVGRG